VGSNSFSCPCVLEFGKSFSCFSRPFQSFSCPFLLWSFCARCVCELSRGWSRATPERKNASRVNPLLNPYNPIIQNITPKPKLYLQHPNQTPNYNPKTQTKTRNYIAGGARGAGVEQGSHGDGLGILTFREGEADGEQTRAEAGPNPNPSSLNPSP